ESVVLPAPEGEDRTSIKPRRAMTSFAGDGRDAFFVRAAAFLLLPLFFRPVFCPDFWPVLAAGVLAITDPRCARTGRGRAYCLSMISSENRFPPLIKSGASFSGSCSIPDSAPALETARPLS